MRKTNVLIVAVVLTLSLGAAVQFGTFGAVENGLGSLFQGVFPGIFGTKADSSTAGNTQNFNNPGYQGAQKTYFDTALQATVLNQSFNSIDGGFNQQTHTSLGVLGNTYFDFESGISSATSFTTADFYYDTSSSKFAITPVNGALAKSVGIVPLNSVDQNTFQNTKLQKNTIKGNPPTWKVANNTVFVWQTAENNAIKMRLDYYGNPLLITYSPIYTISIDGNQNFLATATANGWTGNGTASNPIIIQNYNVSSSQFGALSIFNTNLHFVVQNNVFNGLGTTLNGVVLDNVTNGVFTGNTITGYAIGVLAVESSALSFASNTVSNNANEGFSVGYSSAIAFTGNSVNNNGESGILVANSTTVSVDSNTFVSNSLNVINDPTIISGAVSLVYSSGTVTNNVMTNNDGVGVLLFGVKGDTASGNTITGSQQDGISVVGSDNVVLSGNTVTANVGNGLSVSSSEYTTVQNNQFSSNGQHGIYWINSSYGSIKDNTIVGNSNAALLYAKTGKLNAVLYSGMLMDPSYFNVVEGNNVSLNGIGINLLGSNFNTFTTNTIADNAYNGLSVINSSSNVISTNNVTGNSNPATLSTMNAYLKPGSVNAVLYSGMLMDPSENNTVIGNNFNNNYGYGFIVSQSDQNTFDSNTISSNAYDGAFIENSNWNTFSSNTFTGNGNPVVQSFMKLGSMNAVLYSGMLMDPSYNNTLINNVFSSNYGDGLTLSASDSNNFVNNNMTNNANNGFTVENSNYNNIKYNTMTGNSNPALLVELNSYNKLNSLNAVLYSGMLMDPSHNNNVVGNTIQNNYGYGAWLQNASYNAVASNSLTGNAYDGMFVQDSNYNTITNNDMSSNSNPSLQLALMNTLNSFKPSSLNAVLYSGMLMDPSVGNIVSGNTFANNPGYGVQVQSSSNNVFESNTIANSGMDGFFLQDSSYNNVTSNSIYGSGNTIVLGSFTAAAKPSSLNAVLYSGMLMDPSTNNWIAYNNISYNSGYGVHALDSNSNALGYNQISYNSQQGLYASNSSDMSIMANSFANNALYGTYFDANSHGSQVKSNDFLVNAKGLSSQLFDNGGNTFDANFLLDANPNTAYSIAGSAGSTDPAPAYVPIGNLNSYEFPPVLVTPSLTTVSFNILSTGSYMDAHINFTAGYSAYLTNSSTVFASWNGHYYPMEYYNVQSTQTVHVKFSRQALEADVYAYFIANGITSATITINFTGEFNGGFMAFYGSTTTYAFM